jgi:hypothetical protein
MNVVTTTTIVFSKPVTVHVQATPGPSLIPLATLLLWMLAAVLVSGGLAAVVTVGADGEVRRQRYGVPLAVAGFVALVIGAVILSHLV